MILCKIQCPNEIIIFNTIFLFFYSYGAPVQGCRTTGRFGKHELVKKKNSQTNPSDQSSLCTCHFQMKKLESIVKHRDTQFKHDLKKKEREINKMKERIHQLLTDKNQERRIGK